MLMGCSGVPLYEDVGAEGSADGPASTTNGDGATSSSPPAPSTGAPTPGAATSSHDSTADAASTAEVDTGVPIKLDLEPVPDAPLVGNDKGCNEVDFLFVIDDSPGMDDAQAKLMASVPGFLESISSELYFVERFHLGVITSDAYAGNGPECNALGDMVIHDGGVDGGAGACQFEQGHRYATESDDLLAAFSCAAAVGTSGSTLEQPVTATIAALEQAAEAASCNEGFVGPSSVVVIVIVTDDVPSALELDDANVEEPDVPSWPGVLVSAVEVQDAVPVMIGLVPWGDISCTGAQSPNLIGLVESLDGDWGLWGTLGSVCEPDYGAVFDQAVWSVVDACQSFIWPGGCEVPGGC